MLVQESCSIKEVEVVDSTKISCDISDIEKDLLNITSGIGPKEIGENEKTQESGVMLTLCSNKTGKEYKRFLPESLLRESVGIGCDNLTKENLEFFASQLKNRKNPISITIFSNEVESSEYQSAIEASTDGKVKIKMIGQPKKKKGKKK